MHIVQILPELNQGGVERGVVEFSRELVRLGHESTVISAGGKLAGQIEQDGGRHITLDVCSKNPLTFPFRIHKLRRILQSLMLQPIGNRQSAVGNSIVLHARSRVPAWLCWFANKQLRIPFVTTVHGFNSVGKYSEIMTKGDRVICVSHPIKSFIQENYGTPENKIQVIHRGIDPLEFNPAHLDLDWMEKFRTTHQLKNHFIASSIGRITELKDYETFIRAVKTAAKTMPDIKGLIVGGVRHDKQGYFERLQALTKELQAGEHIVFAGSQDRMPEIYALSDVLVSCSKKPESFGRTLIEAMAMGTPVIATRHGGALDIVREGRNGFLFEPGSEAELSALLPRIPGLDNSSLRDYVLSHFSQKQMVNNTLAVYVELLDSGS